MKRVLTKFFGTKADIEETLSIIVLLLLIGIGIKTLSLILQFIF